MEAEKGKKMDSPLELPEREATLADTLILALNPISDF